MTNEQAKSELMQIYMSLSEEKKKALDVLMAQADEEKTCGTCRNEDTYHCADCENKSDYEQAQADGEYIKKSDMIDWLKDIRHKMKPQNYHTASEFEIAENQIWNLIQMLQMGAFPTVAIPSAEPQKEVIAVIHYDEDKMREICKEVAENLVVEYDFKGKTNGEVIKAVFPNFHTDEMSHTVWVGYDAMSFHRDWWDSPYEPQERSE